MPQLLWTNHVTLLLFFFFAIYTDILTFNLSACLLLSYCISSFWSYSSRLTVNAIIFLDSCKTQYCSFDAFETPEDFCYNISKQLSFNGRFHASRYDTDTPYFFYLFGVGTMSSRYTTNKWDGSFLTAWCWYRTPDTDTFHKIPLIWLLGRYRVDRQNVISFEIRLIQCRIRGGGGHRGTCLPAKVNKMYSIHHHAYPPSKIMSIHLSLIVNLTNPTIMVQMVINCFGSRVTTSAIVCVAYREEILNPADESWLFQSIKYR